MRLALYLVLALAAVCGSGCTQATANKINKVQMGMTKTEVIGVMGEPVSVSAQGTTEYLNYRLYERAGEADAIPTTPYFVRLVNGKVESYGRTGDFDSTQKPTIQIKREDTVSADVQTSAKPDLYSDLQRLKSLREEGAITEDEYQTLKKKLIEGR